MYTPVKNEPPGATLRAIRKGRGWSLRYVADLAYRNGASLTFSGIQRIESNRGYTKQSLEILASIYRVPVPLFFLPPEIAHLADLPDATRQRIIDQIAETAALYRAQRSNMPT